MSRKIIDARLNHTGFSPRLDIQGLRAVAVLGVIMFHAGVELPGGFAGVDVFFVVSGFVITGMLQREYAKSNRVQLGRFYARRFRRLAPALALMVAFTLLVAAFLQSPLGPAQVTAKTALGATTGTANFVINFVTGGYFAAAAETNPLLHTWSLSVEEQFYLIFPALLVVGFWLARRRWTSGLYIPVVILALVSAILTAVSVTGLDIPGQSFLLGFYSPFTRSWEFAAGALLAIYLSRRTVQIDKPKLATTVGIAGIVLLVFSLLFITEAVAWPSLWTVIPVISVLLLIYAGSLGANFTSAFLGSRPMVWIGDRSYSLYLWHWPFIVFAAILVPGQPLIVLGAAILSVVPALLSYSFVEQPVRLKKSWSVSRSSLLIGVVLVIPVVLSVGLITGADRGWGLGMTAPPKHIASINGCTDTRFDPQHCTWTVPDSTGTLMLVGDSQADSYSDAVVAASRNLTLNTVIASKSACPFTGVGTVTKVDEYCSTWQSDVLSFALESRPEVVLIANRIAGYVHPEWNWVVAANPEGTASKTIARSIENWNRGMTEVIGTLERAGISVVLLDPIPDTNNRSAVTSDSLLWKLTGFGPSVPTSQASVSELGQILAPVNVANALIVGEFPETVVYSPLGVLCPDGFTCPSRIDGVRMYLDWGHLTVAGSKMLVPGLEKSIELATRR